MAMNENGVIDERFLTLGEVLSRYGVKRATVYNWEKLGRFPARCKLGRATRWRLSDLLGWERSLPRGGAPKESVRG